MKLGMVPAVLLVVTLGAATAALSTGCGRASADPLDITYYYLPG